MQIQGQSDATLINLGESIKISSIHEQKNIYSQALHNAKTICISAEHTLSADTASLQLLLSFVLTAKQRQLEVKWQSCSLALKQTSRLLGIDNLFNFN